MENVHINNFRQITIVKIVIIMSFLFCIVISILFFSFKNSIEKDAQKNILLIDKKGNIYNGIQFLDPLVATKMEAKAHLKKFILYFYRYDKNVINYNLKLALFMSDATVLAIYNRNTKDNIYQNIVSQSGVAYVNELELDQNIKFDGANFNFEFGQNVFISGVMNNYNIRVSGTLISVARSEDNVHGFLITNFKEKITLIK